MARIPVLVATMTGTAELAAEEIVCALSAAGLSAEIVQMEGASPDVLADCEEVFVVSSTYGHGDIPDGGQAFYAAIKAGAADLKGKRFAVFGLGDRTYADTFCRAGELWDQLFADQGGERMAPLCRHDASSGTLPEDVAGSWAADIYAAKAA